MICCTLDPKNLPIQIKKMGIQFKMMDVLAKVIEFSFAVRVLML